MNRALPAHDWAALAMAPILACLDDIELSLVAIVHFAQPIPFPLGSLASFRLFACDPELNFPYEGDRAGAQQAIRRYHRNAADAVYHFHERAAEPEPPTAFTLLRQAQERLAETPNSTRRRRSRAFAPTGHMHNRRRWPQM